MMIGNKNSYLFLLFPVLILLFAAETQALALGTDGAFSVTKFNLEPTMTPEEVEKERKRNSPLNPDLLYRVAFGRSNDVIELLKQGADPNTKNELGHSVLMNAITRKDEEAAPIVRALLEYGANPNVPDKDGTYPVTEVVKSGRADVLQVLIDYKAVLTYAKDQKGRNLKELGELRNDMGILAVLTPALEAEKARIDELKSLENFISMIQEYAFLNCANEYLSYYISVTPEGVDIGKFNNIITQNVYETSEIVKRIQFMFKIKDAELKQISHAARRDIVQKLSVYETAQNRKINGIGTDKDLNNRCWKVAKQWNARNMNRKKFEYYIQ